MGNTGLYGKQDVIRYAPRLLLVNSLIFLVSGTLHAQADLGSTTLINSFSTQQDLQMIDASILIYAGEESYWERQCTERHLRTHKGISDGSI